MCGLVGIAGYIDTKKHAQMFREMLLFDTVRGLDSTGVASIYGKDKNPLIEKELGHPANLWESKFSKLFTFTGGLSTPSRVLMGHNRSATMGRITLENAHPFQYDHIIGAHNGTLHDWSDLEDYKTIFVDSQAIFNTIAKKGIDHCWKSFRGAAALSFWDDKTQTINLIRNKERPLYVCMSKTRKTLFWASEPWMIRIAAMRAKEDLAETKNKEIDIFQLKEDVLHSYEVSFNSVDLVEVRELEKKPVPVYAPITRTTSRIFHNKQNKNVNLGWTKGLLKSEKDVRGRKCKFSYCIKPYGDDDDSFWYIVGHLLDKNGEVDVEKRIELLPDTLAEWEEWDRKLQANRNKVYVILARPRLAKSFQGRPSYRLSAKEVELDKDSQTNVLYYPQKNKTKANSFLGPNGVYVDDVTWWGELIERDSSCCCLSCGNPMNIDDHDGMLWLDNGVLCPPCAEDPTILDYVKQYINGA